MNDNLAPIVEAVIGETSVTPDINEQASILYRSITGREASFSLNGGSGGFKVHKYNPLVEQMLRQFISIIEPGSGKDSAILAYLNSCFPRAAGTFAALHASKDQTFLTTLAEALDDVTATVPAVVDEVKLRSIVPYIELYNDTAIVASGEAGGYCITSQNGVDSVSPLQHVSWEQLCSSQLLLAYTNVFGEELTVAQLLYKNQCVYFIPMLTGDVLGSPYDPNTMYLWGSTMTETNGLTAFNYYLVSDGSPTLSTLYGLWHVPSNWIVAAEVTVPDGNPNINDSTPGVVSLHEQLLSPADVEGAPGTFTAVAPVPKFQAIFLDGQSVDDPGFIEYGPSVSLEL